jgi:hypothetical protein
MFIECEARVCKGLASRDIELSVLTRLLLLFLISVSPCVSYAVGSRRRGLL